MKRAVRATVEVWTGTGLIVVAGLLLRYLGYSGLGAAAFAVSVLIATALIVHSIRQSGDDDEP